MLADQPIDVMLLATDLGVAKRFYAGQVGLEVFSERRGDADDDGVGVGEPGGVGGELAPAH